MAGKEETQIAQDERGPPPSYSGGNVVDEPPPSYDSLYGELRAARQTAPSNFAFAKAVIGIIVGTIGCTICIGFTLAIPISMIAIGSIFVHDCNIQRYIPIYLIVFGCVGLVRTISSFGQNIRNRRNNADREENARTNPFDGLLGCFLFAWFIAGNVWIYSVYGSVTFDNTSADSYCHPILYWYAFWITTASYILAAASCGLLCCCCVAAMCATA